MASEIGEGRRLVAGRSIRWNDERAREAYANHWWVRETLADALQRATVESPGRIILIDGDHRLDCASVNQQALAIAAALLKRASPGDVVSFMLPNWHEAAAIYLGITLAGMIAHPILPSFRERDLLYMLRDIDSRVIFVPGHWRGHDYGQMLSTACAKLDRPPLTVVVRGDAGDHVPIADFMEDGPGAALPTIDPDEVRMILYTSGTTGTPKGVMHTHNSIHALIMQLREHWHIDRGDRFIVPSPISHIGGSIYAFEMPLLLGTQAILMERWESDEAVDLIDRHECTHMAGATPFLEGLLASAKRKRTRLPSLKVYICGGASVPPSLIRSSSLQFDNTAITRVYGSTEVPVITVGVPDREDTDHAADTDGRLGFASVKLESHAASLGDGEGEIYARGPQMLVGYHDSADEESVFDADGYYRTGDLGHWVDGDYLVISGRAKDIIIRNGENISPKEIEDLLLEHRDVADAAIIGLPHPVTGERACAVVVPRAGAGTLTLESLNDFLRAEGIASFKLPERLELRSELPKSSIGKVLKHLLRSEILAPVEGG